MDLGMNEILLILVVALLVYGGDLPQVARKIGRTIGSLKRAFLEASAEATRGIDAELGGLRNLADPSSGAEDVEDRPRTVRRVAPRELATEDVSGEPAPAPPPGTDAQEPRVGTGGAERAG